MPPAADACISYQLHIRVARRLTLEVGRLGAFDFPRGAYVYTGSARKNLEARIARHLAADKTLRWHIDYLLAAAGVTVERVLRSTVAECALHQATPGTMAAAGFGASDCRAGCSSHLKRTDPPPSARMLAAQARADAPWSVYLLECQGAAIYTGIARDVAARFAAHRRGTGARFTRSHPPLSILVEIPYPDQRAASRAEYAIKQLTAAQKRVLVRRLQQLPAGERAAAIGDDGGAR